MALLNVHKPRDRSHYERFAYWHAAFYRAVEATSVTPFAPRALDRGLAAAVVGMARLADGALTPNSAAASGDRMRPQLDWAADVFRDRVLGHKTGMPAEVATQVRARVESLLDAWASLAHDWNSEGTSFGYSKDPRFSKTLLHEVLEPGLELGDARERRFRAPRSFRDVEPAILLRKIAPNGAEID